MAISKIYKIGNVLFVDTVGESEIRKYRHPDMNTVGDVISIIDLAEIEEGSDVQIADVRNKVNAAIGGQTKIEVEEYVAGLLP